MAALASSRARLLLLCLLIALLVAAIRRRMRAALLLTRTATPATPAAPTTPPPPPRVLLRSEGNTLTGNLLTLEVHLARLKVRNLPQDDRSFLFDFLPFPSLPKPPLRLCICWAGSRMLRSEPAESGAAGAPLLFPEHFGFEHTTSIDHLREENLEVQLLRDGAPEVVGRVVLPLQKLAQGPTANDHAVVGETGQPTGARLAFRCRISELRPWQIQLRDVRLSLLPDFEVSESEARVYVFSLSYIFTSGSSASSSGEQQWRAETTRMRLAGQVAEGPLCWGMQDGEEGSAEGGTSDELPTIVHHGAFWEVRHGALRLQLRWKSFASAASAAASRWRAKALPPSQPTSKAPLPLSLEDSMPIEDNADDEEGGAGAAKAWVVLEKVLLHPQADKSPPSPSWPAERLGDGAKWGAIYEAARREPSGASADGGGEHEACAEEHEWRRRIGLRGGEGEASRGTKGEESGGEEAEAEARRDGRKEGGGGEGARLAGGGAALPFSEPLYCNGRVVGHACGLLCLLDTPTLEQQHHGTLTENGVSFSGPVVLGDERKHAPSRSASGGSIAGGAHADVQRLKAQQAQLQRALMHGDERGRAHSVAALRELLSRSDKESFVSYVFHNVASLHECRGVMMSLWEELLDQLEAQTLGFAARADCYTLILLLQQRGEIGCTLDDAMCGAGDETPLSQLLRWHVIQQRTLAIVLHFVDEPPAGGDGPAMRDFCATVMAHSFFRLPVFAHGLLVALQTGDVLDHDVPEFRGITFALDCADEIPMLAEHGMSEHPPVDWRHLHHRVRAALAAAQDGAPSASPLSRQPSPGSPAARSSRGSARDVLLAPAAAPRAAAEAISWPEIRRRISGARSSGGEGSAARQRDQATPAELAGANAAREQLGEAIRSQAWRQRLRRRGHLFCRLFYEWMQVVCDSLEVSTPPHFVTWHRLPGFKTMLICLLLEMRARPVPDYPEPLVQITNQLLRCTHLHSLFVKIVFLKCSIHDVAAVSTSLNLLSSWMASLQQRLFADASRSTAESESTPVSQPLLRSTFDFTFFFKGMSILFHSEHAQVLLKAIEFLYRHWDLLPEAQADRLRLVVLRSCYWRLLLHWSPAVRHFWCHLLVFRMQQRCCWSLSPGRNPSESPSAAMLEFSTRFKTLQSIAEASAAGAPVDAPVAATSIVSVASSSALSEGEEEGGVPAAHLLVYVPPALALLRKLLSSQSQLQAALDSGESVHLPKLHWDTSVLDVEEDRIIWIRESDLGKHTVPLP